MASIQSRTDPRVAKPQVSLRDRLSGYMASGLDLFETDARRKAYPNISQDMAKELMPIVENVPGVGQGIAAEDLGQAVKDKSWWGMGAAALGLVPGLGGEGKVAKDLVEDVADVGKAAKGTAKIAAKAAPSGGQFNLKPEKTPNRLRRKSRGSSAPAERHVGAGTVEPQCGQSAGRSFVRVGGDEPHQQRQPSYC